MLHSATQCYIALHSELTIHLFRALLTLLLFIFLLAFWLFYGVRLVEQRRKIQYSDIVQVTACSRID